MAKKNLLLIGGGVVALLFALLTIASKTSATVRVHRTFNAPVSKVWALWNHPEAMKQWWGPKGFTAPVIANDPREGGSFLLSMKDSNGKVSYNAGTYTEVAINKKMTSRMWFSDENGKAISPAQLGLPGEWPETVTVSVEFEDLGEQTRVSVEETGLPAIMFIFARWGWSQQFDKFEALLK